MIRQLQKRLNAWQESNVQFTDQEFQQIGRRLQELTFQSQQHIKILMKYDGILSRRCNGEKNPCCSFIFNINQKVRLRDQSWYCAVKLDPPQRQSDLLFYYQNLRSNYVSFLNEHGGVIFLGLEPTVDYYTLNVKGVSIKPSERDRFVSQISKVVNEIYPLSGNFRKNYKKSPNIYVLNEFVQLQLINIIQDGKKSSRQETKAGMKIAVQTFQNYIIKLVIKTTHKCDTYQVDNPNNKMFDSYQRKMNYPEKLRIEEFQNLYYERSDQFLMGKYKPENPKCPFCRFDYSVPI